MSTSTRTRMRPEERRQQILNVALDLFAQRGFEEVTIGDIASAMNIVRPTIYIYFPSTNAILDAIFDDLLNSYCKKSSQLSAATKACPRHKLFRKYSASYSTNHISSPYCAAVVHHFSANVTHSLIKSSMHYQTFTQNNNKAPTYARYLAHSLKARPTGQYMKIFKTRKH